MLQLHTYFISVFSEIKFLRCRRDAERLAQTEEKPKAAALQKKKKENAFNTFLFHDYNIRTA